jgi:ankyrin repeat protein
VETRTINQRTPLHIVCLRGDLQTAKILIKSKANINATDIYGNTPSHYASQYGNAEVLGYLLKYKPLLYIKNLEGKTPIDVAQNPEIIDIFGKYVSKIKMKITSQKKQTIQHVNSKNQILYSNPSKGIETAKKMLIE